MMILTFDIVTMMNIRLVFTDSATYIRSLQIYSLICLCLSSQVIKICISASIYYLRNHKFSISTADATQIITYYNRQMSQYGLFRESTFPYYEFIYPSIYYICIYMTQFLTKVYTDIFESQKGYQVQISVHLKKVQQYLFDKSCPQFTNAQISLLLNGIPEQKIQGLYQFCGNKGSFGSGLKKSSFYALQILYRAMNQGKNKEGIMKHFSQSDEQDFKQIRLATHISQDKSKTAYLLCGIIKEKRPYLSQNDYLYSEEAKKKFKKWFEEQKKNKKTEVKRRVQAQQTITSVEVPDYARIEANKTKTMKITVTKDTNISTKLDELQFLDLDLIEDEQQYFLDTFVDPIDIWNLKRFNSQQRQKISFKQYMIFFIQTPISRIQKTKIEEKINYIHCESEAFSPAILMEKYHKDMQDEDKHAVAKSIPYHFGKQSEKNLVKYFFTNFIEIEHAIMGIKDNFDQNQKIRNDSNIGFSLRTKMKNSMKYLSSRVEPLYKKYEQCEKLRNLILFLEQNSQFAKLPTTILYLQEQDKINQIPLIYSRYQKLIEAYQEKPVIRAIIKQIQSHMIQTRIKQINKVLSNYEMKEANTLIGLFYNKKDALRAYIVPKMIYTILDHIGYQGPELEEMEKELKKYELVNFKQIVKFNKKSNVHYQVAIEEGDLLQAFLSETQFKQMDYEIRCELFQQQIQSDLTAMCQILNQWRAQYNLFFNEKQLLIKGMIEWCAQITESIKKQQSLASADQQGQKMEKCVKVVCKMLIIISKYVDDRDFSLQIEKLKEENFELFCNFLIRQTQKSIDFHACIVKRDQDKNYYNDLVVNMVQDTLKGCKKITAYPSFNRSTSRFYENLQYKYICICFDIDRSLLGELPGLLTYAAVIATVTDNIFMQPFYQELFQFGETREKLESSMKQKNKAIKQILHTKIKILYSSIIIKSKCKGFATQILQLLNNHVFITAQYALNCYKNWTRFIMESFLNEISRLIKEGDKQIDFYLQLLVIRSMTNKITSTRIQQRWEDILKKCKISREEQEKVEVDIFKQKHKNSVSFKALLAY